MGLFANGAIVSRELLLLTRQKYFYWKRVGLVAALLFSTIVFHWPLAHKPSGFALFLFFSQSTLVVLSLFSFINAIYALEQEKKRNTLELTILSPIHPFSFFCEKFLANLGEVLLIYLSFLPLLMFCVMLGGVSATTVLVVSLLLVVNILMWSSIGYLLGIHLPEKSAVPLGVLLFFF